MNDDTKHDDGGPAYPNAALGASHFNDPGAYPGMSLRDWFAGQAVAGLLASGRGIVAVVDAYDVADAMISERKGRTK